MSSKFRVHNGVVDRTGDVGTIINIINDDYIVSWDCNESRTMRLPKHYAETMWRLCSEVYGTSEEEIIEKLEEANKVVEEKKERVPLTKELTPELCKWHNFVPVLLFNFTVEECSKCGIRKDQV